MIQGVKQWFSANWPKLLAGAIAALAAFVGLNILTGGAITAALPAIMQVVGVVMGGVALANIAGHVGDYLSKGWAGDIAGGAKSLARGLAAGAVELVFALLFSAGAVIKAVKGGLKGTAKAAKGAVKNTVKTTVKSVKELGQISAKGAKTALKNGKIMLDGVKGGFAKGAKSLDDLAQRLGNKLRFNKFKIRRQGLRIQLLGHINPWILLADGSIKEVKQEELPELARVGDELMTPAGRGQIVALGDDLPNAKLTSLIDRRPPKQGYEELLGKNQQRIDELKEQMRRADINDEELQKLKNEWLEQLNRRDRREVSRTYKEKGKEYEIGQEYSPRNPAEAPESMGKEKYDKLVQEWRDYQRQLAERRYQGMKNNPQGTDPGDWERYQHYMAERGRRAQGDMTFEQWTKLSREQPSSTRRPGEGIEVEAEWGNPKSDKAYGHTVKDHGSEKKAYQVQDRARNTGNPQGHWHDDQLIVEAEQLAPLKPGEHIINMGKPVGNVYLPDGTVLEDVKIVKVIRKENLTLKTAYPFN
jgi:uncharacterized protein YcnI